MRRSIVPRAAELFAMLWLGQMVAAVTSASLPPDLVKAGWPTSLYYANDLAIVLPLLALAGHWLYRGDSRGTLLAVPLLAFATLMDVSIFATLASGAADGQAVLEPGIARSS